MHEEILRGFDHHVPDEEQIKRIETLREAHKALARLILGSCPESRDRSIAITNLEEVCMRAVRSVVLEKKA